MKSDCIGNNLSIESINSLEGLSPFATGDLSMPDRIDPVFLMDVHPANPTDEIERYQKRAAFFLAAAGIMKLLGLFYSLFVGVPYDGWTTLLPTVLLVGLGIGVYKQIRGTWSASFILCTLFAYALVSQLTQAPWSVIPVNWQLVCSMIFVAAAMTTYVLSIVFLFLMQYKKNRLLGAYDIPR
jgi:hypothetical protein